MIGRKLWMPSAAPLNARLDDGHNRFQNRMMENDYDFICGALSEEGLRGRGAFYPGVDDQVPDCGFASGAGTLVLVGNIGGAMWPVFEAGRRDEDDPLDQWTVRVLGRVVDHLKPALGNVVALYPSDGPPYHPFQQWAMRAEPVSPSPIGPLMHPDHGLWHAYRGALAFERKLTIPDREERENPCDTCPDKPCLSTCPIGAFTPGQYDVKGCANYLTTESGDVCLAQGCQARRACPVATHNHYSEAQGRFHMGRLRDNYAAMIKDA